MVQQRAGNTEEAPSFWLQTSPALVIVAFLGSKSVDGRLLPISPSCSLELCFSNKSKDEIMYLLFPAFPSQTDTVMCQFPTCRWCSHIRRWQRSKIKTKTNKGFWDELLVLKGSSLGCFAWEQSSILFKHGIFIDLVICLSFLFSI